jgi:hypothetical protein
MIGKQQNIALLIVGNAASENPDWISYANYCYAREKGLRKEAFIHLDTFLATTENWSMEQKIEFVRFLFPFFENVEDADYGLFPEPLSKKHVKPTLSKWCETEELDGNPFRWYGTYYGNEEYLFKALEINPADNLARQQLLKGWTYNIYFAIHHLPEGYIGEVTNDLSLVEKIKEHIPLLTTSELREYWTSHIEVDFEIFFNYVEWSNLEHTDFSQWGLENNKRTGYDNVQSYYFKK